MNITVPLLITLAAVLFIGYAVLDSIDDANPSIDGTDWTYQEITINGLPCIVVGRSFGTKQWSYEGISCNWRK